VQLVAVALDEKDVVGLEVAVHYAAPVRELDPVGDLAEEAQREMDPEATALGHEAAERRSFEVVHQHVQRRAVGQRAEVVHADDVAVLERRRCSGLVGETLPDLRILRELAMQHLQSALDRDRGVVTGEHRAHATLA
jgi:hypothetical protein